jgi:hypothetical protein
LSLLFRRSQFCNGVKISRAWRDGPLESILLQKKLVKLL